MTTFKVAAKHITSGSKSGVDFCMVALSMKEKIKPEYTLIVGIWHFTIYGKNGLRIEGQLPREVGLKICSFIWREKVEPFEFSIEGFEEYFNEG